MNFILKIPVILHAQFKKSENIDKKLMTEVNWTQIGPASSLITRRVIIINQHHYLTWICLTFSVANGTNAANVKVATRGPMAAPSVLTIKSIMLLTLPQTKAKPIAIPP